MLFSLHAVKHIYLLNIWAVSNQSTPIWPSHPLLNEVMIVPDTGEDACGLVASIHGKLHKVHTWLPLCFVGTSLALREVFGLMLGLIALLQAGALKYDDELGIQFDNFGASRIVVVGSAFKELQRLACAINAVLNNFPRWRIM